MQPTPVFLPGESRGRGSQVGWYSHLSQNFPQFIVIHTIKGFGIVNKAEILDSILKIRDNTLPTKVH